MQLLTPRDMDARDIYIDNNLILPRSLKDARLNGKTPFKLNTRYRHEDFETPPDKLLNKKSIDRIIKLREDVDEKVKKKKEVDELLHQNRRSLNAIKSILEC